MTLTIALVAHDRMKPALAEWAARHRRELAPHNLVCTATTGGVLRERNPDLAVATVKSGPLGGDQQIGGMIAEGRVQALIFFPDPLAPQAHDVDVKALLRIALVYDVPCAFNPATADLLVAGGLLAR
ncbi:methylglyoxal synthase [Roseomonas marmotae]|uniref:Methylglyoxal synthase n=1 Tax=Roseomonas marmotae TaxID=2768161 RepID=A0ABS3KDQ0_9PROT|nr:methylglyoxal synthase [Roseomonas marmotae]MBO1074778.1 methylglyoxal synthase [Roseomonas marmotae]QTI80712.1 methylglyoxal synthase [Roseomonas marmotae]